MRDRAQNEPTCWNYVLRAFVNSGCTQVLLFPAPLRSVPHYSMHTPPIVGPCLVICYHIIELSLLYKVSQSWEPPQTVPQKCFIEPFYSSSFTKNVQYIKFIIIYQRFPNWRVLLWCCALKPGWVFLFKQCRWNCSLFRQLPKLYFHASVCLLLF